MKGRIVPAVSMRGLKDVANGRDRREPVFDAPAGEAGELDFRLSPEDRAGGTMARRRASGQGGGRPSRPKKAKRRSGRSLFSKLVYAGLVLCLWGVIGVGGIVAYYASQLPPIDQLAVPKRPPDRKSTRLNSSHANISYAVFCLK